MVDDFDRAILALVQRDNQLTHAQIGERVHLSASSVRRRLRTLRETGVIAADVSIVRLEDPGITVVVLVSFHEESREGVHAFQERMRASPAVTQCYSVAGGVDYVLVVRARDQASYETWGQRELMSDAQIRRYDSHIVWSQVKFTTALPQLVETPPEALP